MLFYVLKGSRNNLTIFKVHVRVKRPIADQRNVQSTGQEYRSMRVREYGSMGVWEYGSVGVWEYGTRVWVKTRPSADRRNARSMGQEAEPVRGERARPVVGIFDIMFSA